MVLKPRKKGDPPPDYGASSDKFTVEIHHGGFFMGRDSNQTYVNAKVDYFDNLSARTWSPVWFQKLSFSLHYPKNPDLNVWWLLPGRKMPEGLRLIVSERDTKVMAAIVDMVKLFVLYFDHDGSASMTDWDDVVINPVSSLPKVVSPSKVGKSQDNIEADDNSNDDSDASEFVDSDYELEEDDPNDCIYPIAYAVVEVECLESWKWFLQTLKQDLDIQNTYPWTIMTDKQKGLIKAVAEVFPESEHRFCVRHMYSNFQKLFKGENLKNQLWACARSTTVVQFNKNMEKMRVLDEKAFKWLEKMPPNTWSRAFFSTYCKCDLLLNNSCEVFNNFILDAREMPVLTMLEQIKGQLMARHYSKEREPGQMWQGPICPKIRKKVNKIAQWANTCYPIPSGNGIFQVQDRDHTFIVDIELRTCECRRWDLTGIPCSHAISCLRDERIPIESKVHDCYSSARFLLAYGPKILPCSDPTTWEKIPGPDVQPPKYEKKVGRPIKNRRKQPIEIETTEGIRLSRHGVSMTCSYCGLSGHNRKGCALRKSGLQPQPNVASSSVEPREEDGSQDFQNIYGEPPISQIAMHYEEGTERPFAMLLGESQPPLSQLTGGSQPTFSQLVADTMISRLYAEASQAATRMVEPVSLPDSSFIISNLPAARPVPPSTATKTGKATLGKRKVEDTKKTKKTKKANDGRA